MLVWGGGIGSAGYYDVENLPKCRNQREDVTFL